MGDHTHGPWKIDVLGLPALGKGHGWYEVDGPEGTLIAQVNNTPPGVYEDGTAYPGCGGDPAANARLIASAPRLLAALRRVLALPAFGGPPDDEGAALAEGWAALQEAEGGA